MRYFRNEDGFIGVTDECPRGMKELVYAGRGPLPGQGIESVCDQAYARNQLEKIQQVAAEDVPDDWFAAIGLEERPEPEPRTVELVIQFPWEGRRKKRKPSRPGTRRYWREQIRWWIALAISVAITWYIVFVWQYQ